MGWGYHNAGRAGSRMSGHSSSLRLPPVAELDYKGLNSTTLANIYRHQLRRVVGNSLRYGWQGCRVACLCQLHSLLGQLYVLPWVIYLDKVKT